MSESNLGDVSIQDDLASIQTLIDRCSDGVKKLYALQDAMKELNQEIENEKKYERDTLERMKILMGPVEKVRRAENEAANLFVNAFNARWKDIVFLEQQAEEQILKSVPPEVKSSLEAFIKKFRNKRS